MPEKESNIELSQNERVAICERCPILDKENWVCNPNLWLNPETNQVFTTKKLGYIKGCGCLISFRSKNKNKHCVAGKW